MAEVTRERTGEIVQAAFAVLRKYPDGLPARHLIEQLKQELALTEYELGRYPSAPGVRFDKIIRFATIPAVKAGWLLKSKGIWTVTEAGVLAAEGIPDPAEFMRTAHRLYAEWKRSQADDEDEDLGDDVEEATASAALEEAEESAWAEIEQHLRQMSPYDFQDLVAALLRAMGYHVSWISPPGPDRGIDIVAYTDPLGAEGPRIKVQVKRRNDHKTNVDDLRSFLAVLGAQDVGIYVATGGFTSDAANEARQQENRRITLIGLQELFDLWVEHYELIDDAERQRLPLRPIYFLASPD